MGDKLEGKIAVITGGASGMGLATAKRFVSEGAYVFIIDNNKKELDNAVSEIGKNISNGIQSDVSILADLDRSFDVVKDQKGHMDILFANAGIIQFAPLGKISEEFDKLFNIDVKRVYSQYKKHFQFFAINETRPFTLGLL
jgi:NAD(P)-dependent dehydrogenase (short-subunit alcohol dehydrogenase family)